MIEPMDQNEREEILALLRNNHHDKLALCDRLEEIADSLPENVDRHICATTARTIDPVLKKAHQFEEVQLYPALLANSDGRSEFANIVEKLLDEHHEDLCFGEEVRDVLYALASDTPVQSADATGYMLRGFFGNLRRHMAFEAELAKALHHAETAPKKSGAVH